MRRKSTVIGLAVLVVTRRLALVVVTLLVIVILGVTLVLGVADGIAAEGAEAGTDGCAFQAATALIADDTADSSAAEGTDDCTGLSIRAGGTGGNGDDGEE